MARVVLVEPTRGRVGSGGPGVACEFDSRLTEAVEAKWRG